MRFLGKIVDQESAPVDAFFELRKRQRLAHRRDRGLHHVDESGVDCVGFRPIRENTRRQA